MAITSPFINARNYRDPENWPRFLMDVPKWIRPYTCRCAKAHGATLDTERNIWVCSNCRLPNVGRYIWNQDTCDYIADCFSCGNQFVIWALPEPNAPGIGMGLCSDCGGDNCAAPGQRTEAPYKMVTD